eukprot:TRINITY_DN56052_c0_g1_i2.p1 TRINITY_DN56052_c0_g1~~TRINITY_DN56052_c0_g1_i2.p1  ORF type:complete len:124 (+),score=30.46 TRINITY_DN56052_c0_g1_i2:92-463(+)
MANHPQYSVELARSMALMLEEFYNNLTCVSMSAVTGEGTDKLIEGICNCKEEYYKTFYPEMLKTKQQAEEKRVNKAKQQTATFLRDLEQDGGHRVVLDGRKLKDDAWEAEEDEEDFEPEDFLA